MKKRILTLLLALALSLSLAVPAAAAQFTDVEPGDYFADAVAWAVENDITQGTSDTTFSPYETCTRAQIITFLYRAAGSEYDNTPLDWLEGFGRVEDISANDYYCRAVLWAKHRGFFEGDYFYPNDPCTRLAAVEFLAGGSGGRAATYAPDAGFSDVNSSEVNWAVAWGITQGTDKSTFSPEQTCTRGQIVTFLHRYKVSGPSTHDPIGSYVHENGGGWIEIKPYKEFEIYEDEYGKKCIAVYGNLKGNNASWSWNEITFYFYPGYLFAQFKGSMAEYYPDLAGKYILQSD